MILLTGPDAPGQNKKDISNFIELSGEMATNNALSFDAKGLKITLRVYCASSKTLKEEVK